jgi:murein DD-endopeptidase / murein LD-carboxypeptidase
MKRESLFAISTVICLLISACSASRKGTGKSEEIVIFSPATSPVVEKSNDRLPPATAPSSKPVQLKYAKLLHIDPLDITNIKLYSFVDNWLGTPYKWGGTNRQGIDCSALVQKILDTAYDIHIHRTSIEQFYANWVDLFASTKKLAEGDLVFFSTIGENAVSHVGMYLHNGVFVNSSSSHGVSLARLDDPYWKSKYVAAGRVKIESLRKVKQ